MFARVYFSPSSFIPSGEGVPLLSQGFFFVVYHITSNSGSQSVACDPPPPRVLPHVYVRPVHQTWGSNLHRAYVH